VKAKLLQDGYGHGDLSRLVLVWCAVLRQSAVVRHQTRVHVQNRCTGEKLGSTKTTRCEEIIKVEVGCA
jgi:hypothetical protein